MALSESFSMQGFGSKNWGGGAGADTGGSMMRAAWAVCVCM